MPLSSVLAFGVRFTSDLYPGPCHRLTRAPPQFEIVIQFFTGTYDKDLNYIDDWKWILQSKLVSLTGFWLDCVTSIPWAWIDMQAYLVRDPLIACCPYSRRPPQRLTVTDLPSLSSFSSA